MNAVKLTSSIAVMFMVIALAAGGHAQEPEEMKQVLARHSQHPGKEPGCFRRNLPSGRQVTIPSSFPVSLRLCSCAVRYHSQPG